MHIYIYKYLVGGFNPCEQYWLVGIIIPNTWENKHDPNHHPDIDILNIRNVLGHPAIQQRCCHCSKLPGFIHSRVGIVAGYFPGP